MNEAGDPLCALVQREQHLFEDEARAPNETRAQRSAYNRSAHAFANGKGTDPEQDGEHRQAERRREAVPQRWVRIVGPVNGRRHRPDDRVAEPGRQRTERQRGDAEHDRTEPERGRSFMRGLGRRARRAEKRADEEDGRRCDQRDVGEHHQGQRDPSQTAEMQRSLVGGDRYGIQACGALWG